MIKEYKLYNKVSPDGWVYIRVGRGMYELLQSGSLGHDLLEQRLNAEGYFQSQIVPGLWKHKSRNIQFVLVVDDFGLKFIQDNDLNHLISMLKRYCDVSVDKTGQEYVKINLDWDYKGRKVHLSMEPYLQKALKQFGIDPPVEQVHSPYQHTPPNYARSSNMPNMPNPPRQTKTQPNKHKQSLENSCGMPAVLTIYSPWHSVY